MSTSTDLHILSQISQSLKGEGNESPKTTFSDCKIFVQSGTFTLRVSTVNTAYSSTESPRSGIVNTKIDLWG